MSATTPSQPGPTKNLTADQQRRQRFILDYEKRTDLTLSALALVYLVTFSIQSIWHEPQETWYRWLVTFGNILWLLFALDLLFRFLMSPDKRHFFRRNWLDTITVVLPQFRALRALRAFMPNGILARGNSKSAISGGAATSAGLAALLVIWIGSLMVLDAERGAPGAEIVTIGDAIWWAFETVTTVGYGDFVPVTHLGRVFAVLIMIVGISVLGVVTASMSASLVKQRGNAAQQEPAPGAVPTPSVAPMPSTASSVSRDDLQRELAEIKSMLADIQQRLDGSRPTS